MTRRLLIGLSLLAAPLAAASAQYPPGGQGSSNIHIQSHLPLGRGFTVSDIEMEQELARPYVYVSRMHGTTHSAGFTIVSVKNPGRAGVLYDWHVPAPELHKGSGGMRGVYWKISGRYYYAQSFQWVQGSPDADLGALVFDVTGLPDTTRIKEVGRIRLPTAPGGFHNMYAYKHSDGRALLFTTTQGGYAHIYDAAKLGGDNASGALIGRVPNPDSVFSIARYGRAYHDMYVGYDPATHQDKFYGAGYAGYYVFDVTRPEEPKLITSVTGVAGVSHAHTFTPTPDGRYIVGESEDQYQPLRIFDLKPALDGTVKTVSRPIGAWTADWKNLAHNHEVRWPYVFVSAYEDGFWVMNMMDPTNPYTVGFYDTYDGPHERGWGGVDSPETGNNIFNGAFGVDVRNADGLIVISDFATGFWAFKMDGFDGWNGHQWGMPDISSVQDWDNGPEGASKPQRVS